MKAPKQRSLQEIVLAAKSKFVGLELSFSSAFSKVVSKKTGVPEKEIMCSVEMDEDTPVYGLNSDHSAVLIRYNARVLIPDDNSDISPGLSVVDLSKKSLDEFLVNNKIEGKTEVADNLIKLTLFYPSLTLPPEVSVKPDAEKVEEINTSSEDVEPLDQEEATQETPST
jgi:hypothetical protein